MNYERYFICIDPGSEYSGCVVLGVNDDIHIPDILWISSRKEGVGELTKTGKSSKGKIKYNYANEDVWFYAMSSITEQDPDARSKTFFVIIEEPESRMAIFDSKTIQATIWTGRFMERADNHLMASTNIPHYIETFHPSDVRLKIAGIRSADSKEVYIKTREFFDDPDKYEGIKSHARSALNLYVAYQKTHMEVSHA